mmetsp:Transcript_33501/g.49178  ORF Transcript_33501/g.49178 Transcript_33501/m.49178 type:complete len:759 (-) Transcript_33501:2911-5187(-)
MSQASILQRIIGRFQNGYSNNTNRDNGEGDTQRSSKRRPISEDYTELERFQAMRATHTAANAGNDPPVIRSTLNSFLNSSPEGDTALHTLLLLRPSHRVVREMIRLYPEVRLLLASLRHCFGSDMLQFHNDLTYDFVNARNNAGATALHVALRCGCTQQVVDVLLDEGSLEYARYRDFEDDDDEDDSENGGDDENDEDGWFRWRAGGGTGGGRAAGRQYKSKPTLASVSMNAGTYPLHLACLYPFRTTPQQQQQQQQNEQQQQQQQEDHQRPIIERLVAEDPNTVTKMAGWGNTPLSLYWQLEYKYSQRYNKSGIVDDNSRVVDNSNDTNNTPSSSSLNTQTVVNNDILQALDRMDWTFSQKQQRQRRDGFDVTNLSEEAGHKITEKWEVSLLLITTAQQQLHKQRRMQQRKQQPWLEYFDDDDDDDDEDEEGTDIENLDGFVLKVLCRTPFVPPALIQLALMFGHADELHTEDKDNGYLPLHFAVSTSLIFPLERTITSGKDKQEKIPLTQTIRRGKRDKYQKNAETEITFKKKDEKKVYRSAVEVLTTAYPSAASKREKIENRLPLHIGALRMKKWSGCIECLVSAYPEALVMRDPVTGLFPFMLAAVGDHDKSTTSLAMGDLKKEIMNGWKGKSATFSTGWVREDEIVKEEEEEDGEDGQLTVIFELLRSSPEVLSFREFELCTLGENDQKKRASSSFRRSNASLGAGLSTITTSTRSTGKRVWSYFSNLFQLTDMSLSSSFDAALPPRKRRRTC